ncbi:MAG TPA: RHS repeat-associated core domain-containing protein [Fulvivirga sp.]|nr:RHS repeat-associated core domain-containing protein [Fulvivirga sp.]
MKAVQKGFVPMDVDANGAPLLMTIDPEVVSPVAGTVFVYLTNETNTEVYFDDFEVTIAESMVVQNTDYYPFGLQHSTSWTRITDLKNNFLYNAGSELNEKTKNYETFYRDYDPALGRFNQVDPLASKFSNHTPYNYAFNDPVALNDPNGDCPTCDEFERTHPYNDLYLEFDRFRPIPVTGNANRFFDSGYGRGDYYNGPSYGYYSSSSSMINHAWNSTNNGSISYSTYSNGRRTSFAQTNNYAVWGDMKGNGGFVGTFESGLISRTFGTGQGNFYEYGAGHHRFNGGGIRDASGITAGSGGGDYFNAGLNYFVADALRYTPMFGTTENPFYLAEAIFGDFGGMLAGAETDHGFFFILTGQQQGELVGYEEYAGGVANSFSIGIEMGRVDMYGSGSTLANLKSTDTSLFNEGHLFGGRTKYFGAVEFIGAGTAYGTAYDNSFIVSNSIQLGIGLENATPMILTGGINFGKVIKK